MGGSAEVERQQIVILAQVRTTTLRDDASVLKDVTPVGEIKVSGQPPHLEI